MKVILRSKLGPFDPEIAHCLHGVDIAKSELGLASATASEVGCERTTGYTLCHCDRVQFCTKRNVLYLMASTQFFPFWNN